MVSLYNNTNAPQGFYSESSTAMALPNIGGSIPSPAAVNTTSSSFEDASKKIRKPYTVSKSRESWTEPEHDKFLEALQLFDRDWKKIEAFVGSKTVIQIRSHAQKYFLKVQKSGTNEHLPPPRPKRKSAHPYPQKASKIAPVVSQALSTFQILPAVPDPGYVTRPDSAALLRHPVTAASVPGWTDNSAQASSFTNITAGNIGLTGQSLPKNYSSNSNESTPRTRPAVLPDFAQVYGFIGSVFDPDVTDHLQKLKKMDPINIETVLLLMRNLSVNLASPDFEDHRRLLSSYEIEPEKDDAYDASDTMLASHCDTAV